MTALDAIASFTTLATVVTSLAIWQFGLRPLAVAVFRHRVFVLRATLFDLAADGHLRFDQPAYTDLRRTLNGMVRFAHHLNLTTAVVCAVAGFTRVRRAEPSDVQDVRWSDGLSPAVVERLALIRTQAHVSLVLLLMLGTPLVLVTMPLVALTILYAVIAGSARVLMRRAVTRALQLGSVAACLREVDYLAWREGDEINSCIAA